MQHILENSASTIKTLRESDFATIGFHTRWGVLFDVTQHRNPERSHVVCYSARDTPRDV